MFPLFPKSMTVAGVMLAGAMTALAPAPAARADEVAYLIAVTVRPGYNFPSADAALGYGRTICDRVARGTAYSDGIATVKADFSTNDDYQAAYLINQAVDNLCPAQIWQLRQSAAHYRGGPDVGG